MVRDLVHNLCESLVENIGGVADVGKNTPPTPITYLTQWKIVGNSEVHTLPYPDGVVLPNGYKRCEYLTFDGSSYIDTGVKSKSDIEIMTAFLTNAESKCILGARKSGGLPYIYLGIINNTNNTIITGYGSNSLSINVGKQLANGNKHIVTINKTAIIIDGDSFTLSSTGDFDENNHNLLGTWMNDTNPDFRYFVGNIYDTIFSNTQGELWHGIPCLDANDVPCFYDVISQTAFYNQGRGSFTYKLYPQPTEIWSCGEYNHVDGKWHILVQPLGGSIADIALDEPLRKANDVADTIEFPSETEGKALVTRNFSKDDLGSFSWRNLATNTSGKYRVGSDNLKGKIKNTASSNVLANILCSRYNTITAQQANVCNKGISVGTTGLVAVYDEDYNQSDSAAAFKTAMDGVELIYELATPTTELVDAPQIAEADIYTCVISQGGNAVEWSSFITN